MTQPDPEQSISGGQLRSLHRTLKYANLVTKGEILELQSRASAERQRKRPEKRGEDGSWCESEKGQPSMYHSVPALREPRESVTTLTVASWNQLSDWLRAIEALRRAGVRLRLHQWFRHSYR
jgi:hypothetical protein